MTSQQTFVLMKTSFVFILRKRLEDVLKTSWSRTISSEDVFKFSSRRLDQGEYFCFSHTSSRHLQDAFKFSSRRLQDIFMKSWGHFRDVSKHVFKTSSMFVFRRCLEDVLTPSSIHIFLKDQQMFAGIDKQRMS